MQILDCTLRDGANVVGKGFTALMTELILKGLIANNVKVIECGNALGVGAYDADGSIAPLKDGEYMDLVAPYLDDAEIGMFISAKNAIEKNVELAAKKGLKFLRVGANSGDGALSERGIKLIRKYGMKVRYAMMKAYILPPKDVAEEAKRLESYGVDEITLMDSAGFMLMTQVGEYVQSTVNAVGIPVGFHGHNNLGLSSANAIKAVEAGAASLDCGLMGMARSAGNLPTELCLWLMKRLGISINIDIYGIFSFIDNELAPAMKALGYVSGLNPEDIVMGYSGCHSKFLPKMKEIADLNDVNVYQLIEAVSLRDQKSPSESLIEETAEMLREKYYQKGR